MHWASGIGGLPKYKGARATLRLRGKGESQPTTKKKVVCSHQEVGRGHGGEVVVEGEEDDRRQSLLGGQNPVRSEGEGVPLSINRSSSQRRAYQGTRAPVPTLHRCS